MGLSLKKVGNLAGKAVGASVGAYFGGPAGAAAGYSGSDAVLGAVGLGSDDIAAEENYKMLKKAADYKYQQDLNMWNLTNAYNDPAAQMERLQKAGLNPNLVYGGGNVTGNTSGSGPEYSHFNSGYTDRSVERQQIALAMKEHQQRITNQSIQNDMARQELLLRAKASEREDKKLELLRSKYASLSGSSSDDALDDALKRLRIQKLEKELEDKPITELLEDFVTSKAKSFIGKAGNKVINKGVNTILDSVLGKGLSYTKY